MSEQNVNSAPGNAEESPRAVMVLGAQLKFHRLRRGLSQARVTAMIGLSARSNFSDYERGLRLPPLDVVRDCERVLQLADGLLQRLHQAALEERADRWLSNWRPGTAAAPSHDAPGPLEPSVLLKE